MKSVFRLTAIIVVIFGSSSTTSFGGVSCSINVNPTVLVATFANDNFVQITVTPPGPYMVGDQVVVKVDTLTGFLASFNASKTGINSNGDASRCVCQKRIDMDDSRILLNGEEILNLTGGPATELIDFPINIPISFTEAGSYLIELQCAADNNVVFGTGPAVKSDFQKALLGTNIVLANLTAGAAIPTLSQWGMIILAISLLTFGIVSIRSKKSTKVIEHN